MAGLSAIRSTIHSLWESFFPSTIYFVLYAAIAIVLTDSVDTLFATDVDKGFIANLKRKQVYLELKELDLHKAIPVAVFAIFGLLIYLFDRVVSFVSEFIPPFPEWHGSPALYTDPHQLRTLWLLLPHVNNPAALDFEARMVIERAQIEGKTLPRNSKDHLDTRFSEAARTLNYAKSGMLWSLIIAIYVVVSFSASLATFIWLIFFTLLFCLLGLWGIFQQTKILIAQTSEDIRIAEAILRAGGAKITDNSESKNRIKDFDNSLNNSISFAKRFVHLAWKPRREWSPLINAFIGFRLTKGSKGRRR